MALSGQLLILRRLPFAGCAPALCGNASVEYRVGQAFSREISLLFRFVTPQPAAAVSQGDDGRSLEGGGGFVGDEALAAVATVADAFDAVAGIGAG